MKILVKWLIISLVIMAASYILPGIMVDNFFTALVMAVILSFLNLFLKPLLIILTLPLNILTLGLFTLVINTLIVMLADALNPGLTIANFGWAFLFSLIISLTNSFLAISNDDH
ncbi:MAG: phage holin family protein [Candidatus Magasanikbacteria bacterium]|nr:phage holin family protein [Candidatus Magasanikbacteria bacterium]